MISSLMRHLARLPLGHPKKVLVVSLILTLVSLVFIPRLHVSTDRNLLAGKSSEEFIRREEVAEMFGTNLVSVVVLSADTEVLARKAADDLAKRLKNHPKVIKEVFHKADIGFFEAHALMFAPKSAVNEIKDALNSESTDLGVLEEVDCLPALIQVGAEHLATQSMPEGASSEEIEEGFDFFEAILDDVEMWFKDPSMSELGVVARMWEGAASFQGKQDTSGYLTDNDGKSPSLVVMFVQPASNSQAMEVVAPLTDLIRAKARETMGEFRGAKAYVSGMPSLQTDELRLVTRDCVVAGFAAGIGVILVFLIAFRSFRVTLFLVLPLGVGLIWSAGFTGALYGHLTMITSYFAAVLFGLGVAFTIHIVARFHEALLDGEPKTKAVETALVGAGPGVFVGGATTALAFLAIMFSEFKGFAEMGVISGVGVTLILMANLTLLPASLILWHPGVRAVAVKKRTGAFWDKIAKSRLVVPIISVALLVVGAWLAKDIRFNYAVESMLPGNSEAVEAIKLLNSRTDFSSSYSVAVADSPEEAKALADKLSKLKTVSRVEAISNFLPAGQPEKVKLLSEVNPETRDTVFRLAASFEERSRALVGCSAGDLKDSLEDLGDTFEDLAFDAKRAGRPEAKSLNKIADRARAVAEVVGKGDDSRSKELERLVFGLISRGLGVLAGGLRDKGFELGDLPSAVRGRYVSKDGKHFAVVVYPAGDIGERDFFYSHVDELLKTDPGITGHVVTHHRFTEMVHKGFAQAVALSAVAVIFLVFLDLRSFRGLIMALGPVVLSAGWTALLMYLTGFMLNYANLMALPILIGTGVDYGVHMAHRAEQSGSVVVAAKTTGRAIALSGLTTLIGFGSLLLGNHWGVQSLGWLLVAGIFFALVAALVVLPGLMRKKGE